MLMTKECFNRTEMLLGADAMSRMAQARVLLFGVGGVGSWCAEALIRSGIGHLTMVDPDVVDVTNINRQLPATTLMVGRPKVEVMRERLLEINPDAEIIACQERFSADTAFNFQLSTFNYVIDAIDNLADKMELILLCTRKEGPMFFSSMGAACKMDPTQMHVSEFWQIDGCPLAANLRKRMRRAKRFPERKFKCVWSPEVIRDRGKGSLVHVTGAMGFALAGLVLQDI